MRKKREALNSIPTDLNKIYDRAIATIYDQIDSCRELASGPYYGSSML